MPAAPSPFYRQIYFALMTGKRRTSGQAARQRNRHGIGNNAVAQGIAGLARQHRRSPLTAPWRIVNRRPSPRSTRSASSRITRGHRRGRRARNAGRTKCFQVFVADTERSAASPAKEDDQDQTKPEVRHRACAYGEPKAAIPVDPRCLSVVRPPKAPSGMASRWSQTAPGNASVKSCRGPAVRHQLGNRVCSSN